MLLGNSTVTIISRAPGTHSRDGYTKGAETALVVDSADVQPINGSDLKNIPERLHASASYKMYLPVAVPVNAFLVSNTGNLSSAGLTDLVEYDGVRYRVAKMNPYRHFLLQSAKYILLLPETREEHPDGVQTV